MFTSNSSIFEEISFLDKSESVLESTMFWVVVVQCWRSPSMASRSSISFNLFFLSSTNLDRVVKRVSSFVLLVTIVVWVRVSSDDNRWTSEVGKVIDSLWSRPSRSVRSRSKASNLFKMDWNKKNVKDIVFLNKLFYLNAATLFSLAVIITSIF